MPTEVESLSEVQAFAIVVLERAGGCISLLAVLLIFIAYSLVPDVRNVQNTFIVFASVANVGASIASIIAMNGLLEGRESGLCQVQGFLFEMFMQSDPWWSLSMATNVFLVFYFRVSPDSFQKWWWLYCCICYGGPFVIALALLLVRHPTRGRVYGEATIWCWVDRDWDDIRIYSYYMLIWVCIVGSIVLYSLVGYHVFRARNHIRSFSMTSRRVGRPRRGNGPKYRLHGGSPQDGFYGTVITEVRIVHSPASSSTAPSDPRSPRYQGSSAPFNTDRRGYDRPPAMAQYFTTAITSGSPGRQSLDRPNDSPRRSRRHRWGRWSSGSVGRSPESTWPGGGSSGTARSVFHKFVVADPIKRAYLRTSLLFTLSVLVTWIPSSMNRIHSWLTGVSPFEYHVATAAVLPLQGVWNAVIFFVTSSAPLKRAAAMWRGISIAADEEGGAGPNNDENGPVGHGQLPDNCVVADNDDVRDSDGESGMN